MDPASEASAAPWLAACRRAAAALGEALAAAPTTVERAREVGRGEGGDMTVAVDETAEETVFAVLAELHDAGHRFTAVSEERGEVAFGDRGTLVVIDPIDGSLNAKRGLPPHCLSIAVADGPTIADVAVGFVHDFGTGEEWVARRGGGARLGGGVLGPGAPERGGGASGPGPTGPSWTPSSPSAATAAGASRWSRWNPPTPAGSPR